MGEEHRKLKVAFFTQGFRTPSSRFRVEQLLPAFRQRGLACTVYPANPSNQGETRTWSPQSQAMRASLRMLAVPGRLSQIPRGRGHDVVFFQKPLLPFPSARFERWLARQRPCVFDLDDALYLKRDGRRWIRGIVEACHRVVVGNAHLAEELGAPEKTLIIPTVVDTERYSVRPWPSPPFTVGWTGIAHNLKELEPLVPELERFLKETGSRLLLVAERFPGDWLHRLPVEKVTWTPEAEVEALARIHVGLMPLADTEFNRGKCGFKLLQYMARGIPVIASPVGANKEIVRQGVDGFLVGGKLSWKDALFELLGPSNAATLMGKAARARVETEYSINAVLHRYMSLFRGLA